MMHATTTAPSTPERTDYASSSWTEAYDYDAYQRALALCRGNYQRQLIQGYDSLSGSTLRGRAKTYSGRYAASRDALLARMTAAGIPWHEERQAHGRRVLVIG